MKIGTIISTRSFSEQVEVDPSSATYALFVTEPASGRRIYIGDDWRMSWPQRLVRLWRRGKLVAAIPSESLWEIVDTQLIVSMDITQNPEETVVGNEPAVEKVPTGQYL